MGPNTITYMPVTIAGIGAVTNDEAATGGYDAESDEEFRARYYNDLQNPNNGSNQQAYIAWAMSVPGVGRVRIFPQALGANTVEVCLVDPNMEPAGSEVIQAVQALIDPNKNGDGSGEAPIGAVCTVTTGGTPGDCSERVCHHRGRGRTWRSNGGGKGQLDRLSSGNCLCKRG